MVMFHFRLIVFLFFLLIGLIILHGNFTGNRFKYIGWFDLGLFIIAMSITGIFVSFYGVIK